MISPILGIVLRNRASSESLPASRTSPSSRWQVVERDEGIQSSVGLHEVEIAEDRAFSAVIPDRVLVLEAATEEDGVDVILDRRGLLPIEHTFADETSSRARTQFP